MTSKLFRLVWFCGFSMVGMAFMFLSFLLVVLCVERCVCVCGVFIGIVVCVLVRHAVL